MIRRLFLRQPLPIYGNGSNVRDWLHVEDHCDAIWRIIEAGRVGETYNVGGDSERSNLEVVKLLTRLMSQELNVDEAELTRLHTFVTDRPGHDQRYAIDATKLKVELGWSPTRTFETGLAETVRWYLANPDWVQSVETGAYRDWIQQHYA